MILANLWLAFKIVGFVLWAIIFLVVSLILFYLWEEFNNFAIKILIIGGFFGIFLGLSLMLELTFIR
jgi:hypothetical protein